MAPRAGFSYFRSVSAYVNARFLGAPATGVQRYARELLKHLPELKRVQPSVSLNGFAGHLWEQTALLAKTSDGVLWSPCNSGPILHKNHAVTIHDLSPLDFPQGFTRKYRAWYSWLLPQLARHARIIFVPSQFVASRLIAEFSVPDKKLVLTSNAVSSEFKKSSAAAITATKKTLGIETDYVFCVGSTDARKNTGLIQQIAEEMRFDKNVSFLLAGGSARKVYANLEKGERPSRVRHLGFVEDAILRNLMSGATAFLFPSLYEGFGLPLLEAMACDTPVLASDIPVFHEVAGDAALYCDPKAPSEWASALRSLLRQPALRAQLTQRGHERRTQYSWEKSAAVVSKTLARF